MNCNKYVPTSDIYNVRKEYLGHWSVMETWALGVNPEAFIALCNLYLMVQWSNIQTKIMYCIIERLTNFVLLKVF